MTVDLELDGDEGDVSAGLTALVVAVVEILLEALESEAVRRMESGDLTDAEVERLGRQLLAIEEELAELKRTADVVEATADLRRQLDGVVQEALVDLDAQSESESESGPGGSTDGTAGVDRSTGETSEAERGGQP